MRGLEAEVHARLDARLKPHSPAPLAVALSGGSDSLALTLLAAAWARARGRPLLVLSVDHRLRAESADWIRVCAAHAERLGAGFQALAWTGAKPTVGLPAAARTARHALLATAARKAGAAVILMGHTADDLAETAAMRAEGATTPDVRDWSPSPAWPEGRGVFLLRPLLAQSREGLRTWLAARGETWIEDPANGDLRFARARARALKPPPAAPAARPDLRGLAQATSEEPGGGLVIPRQALRAVPPEAAMRFTGIAALCAAGTTRPPRADRLARLTEALQGRSAVTATLAGARIEAGADQIAWRREPGEFRRRPPTLAADVWDGRVEMLADAPLQVTPLAGRAADLSDPAARAVRRLPPSARGALPLVHTPNGAVCPMLETAPGLSVRSLSLERLRAACGVIAGEP